MDNEFYYVRKASMSCATSKLSRASIRIFLTLFLGVSFGGTVWSTQLDDIGYTALQTQLGSATPDGTGVSISQVEAPDGGGNFIPNRNDGQLTDKTFVVAGTASGNSNHALNVARNFYGNTSSAAGGITDIHLYQANSFIGADLLRRNGLEPRVETQDIQNHSWILNSIGNTNSNLDLLKRLDFMINRDDVTVVAALNNLASTSIPAMWGNSYNSIIVGRTDGLHSTGQATLDGPARQVPHLVVDATLNYTSYATPIVSSAAAVLLETARSETDLHAADRNEVIRSLLLAGATKEEVPQWSNSPTEPLDNQFGAGELNIHRSYNALVAGQQTPSSTDLTDSWGWDLQTDATGIKTYFFDIPTEVIVDEFSAALTWNREIIDTNSSTGFSGQFSGLNDLDLRLYSATGFTLNTMLAESISDGNVEHIYFNDQNYSDPASPKNPLTAGRYALVVDAGNEMQDYALSWFRELLPTPVSLCDLDNDGDCDPTDLANLYANFDSGLSTIDIDGSGVVDADDISAWLGYASDNSNPFNKNESTFVIGDVDFDGSVGSADLGRLLNHFGDSSGRGYNDGNLNGDGVIDTVDLGQLLNNFGFGFDVSPGFAVSSVPEPSLSGWAIFLLIAAAMRWRR